MGAEGAIGPQNAQKDIFNKKLHKFFIFLPRILLGKLTAAVRGLGVPPKRNAPPPKKKIPGYAYESYYPRIHRTRITWIGFDTRGSCQDFLWFQSDWELLLVEGACATVSHGSWRCQCLTLLNIGQFKYNVESEFVSRVSLLIVSVLDSCDVAFVKADVRVFS